MSNENTFEALEKRWRFEQAPSPDYGQDADYWTGINNARGKCADELAMIAPHYVHKDKLRELRDRCIEGAKLFANAEAASVSQAIGDKLTALLGDKP